MHQLTPELAEDIAGFDLVMFVDADVRAEDVMIEPLAEKRSPPGLTHDSTAAEVVALSRELFGFAGRAFRCGIPASDFSARAGLSAAATQMASRAARELETLLGKL